MLMLVAHFEYTLCSHAETLLRTLHQQPVQQRIHYQSKPKALTYETRATSTPDYLSDMISAHSPGARISLRLTSIHSWQYTIDKNGKSSFRRVRASGLDQSTRIRAIVRVFKTIQETDISKAYSNFSRDR